MPKVPSDLTRDNLFDEAIWEHNKVLNEKRTRETKRLREALVHCFRTDFGVTDDFLGITYHGIRYHIRTADNGNGGGLRLALYWVSPVNGHEMFPQKSGTVIPNVFGDLDDLGKILYEIVEIIEEAPDA